MKKIYIFIINFLLFQGGFAQTAIDVEQTFGELTGFSFSQISSFDIQPDGKILIGGNLTTYNNNSEKGLMRFNVEGYKDPTFNVTGTGFTGINATYLYHPTAITSQPDGKIIVGGNFTKYNGISQNGLIRLNSDGTKDTTFNIGTGFSFSSTLTTQTQVSIQFIKLQPDGKILIGGNFTSYNGVVQNNINPFSGLIRLNANGTIDSTFNIDTGFYGGGLGNIAINFSSIAIQPNGKILVGGSFTSYRGVTSNQLVRLNSDGSIDTQFNIGFGFNPGVSSNVGITDILIQTDGKILVGGNFTTFNGLTQNRLIRLNSDCTKDNTFDLGTGFDSTINNMIYQTDGKIIVAGQFTTFNGIAQNRLIRLNSDGSKDNTFNVGTGFSDSQFSLAIKQQGSKIIGAGQYTTYNGNVQNTFVRINPNGIEDDTFLLGNPGFNNGPVTPGIPFEPGFGSLCLQSDGKLLVGGSFVTFNGITENKLIRFNSDGKKDTTFNIRSPSQPYLPYTGFDTGGVGAIAVQTDGKILLGGTFTTFNNVSQNRLIRLNSDGTKDNTFIIGTGFNDFVSSIVIQPNGKILIGGIFSNYNGLIKYGLIRLNNDGTIDSTFNTTLTQTNTYVTIAIQPDGKIVLGRQIGNQSQLIRLNSDGSNDVLFNVGTGLNSGISKIVIQTDNKILVGGSFTTYNGISQRNLIRFNIDGTKDLTFNLLGSGFTDGGVYDIAIQPDNKIIIAGVFSTYNGIYQSSLLRINPDGSIDNSFLFGDTINSRAFPNGTIYSIAIKSNGNIFAGGTFRNYFNYASSGLVGIRGNAVLSNENFENTNNEITLFPNPVDNVLNFQTSNFSNVSKVNIYDLIGNQIIKDKNVINDNIDISNLSKGIYLIKMTTTNNETITKKIIKN